MDQFASTGKVIVRGTLAAQEVGADSTAISGKVLVNGALSATESGQDSFAATGGALGAVSGAMAVPHRAESSDYTARARAWRGANESRLRQFRRLR